MKKTPKYLIIFLCLCLLIVSGCSIIVAPVKSPNRNLSKWAVSDPNYIGLNTKKNPDGSLTYNYCADFNTESNNTIPFWKSEYNFLDIPVAKGQINNNTYPVVFDTGNSIQGTIIEDIHVVENNLPIFLFNDDKGNGAGMAMITDFKVGTLHANNYPCLVMQNHTKVELLGIPVSRSRHVIIPLVLMSQFKYFEFDQIKHEIRFSPEHSYKPQYSEQWHSLPFEIKDNRILISISLEGIQTVLFLDTGAGLDIELSSELAEKLFEKRPDLKKNWKLSTRTYGPYSDGLVNQKRINAKDLQLGDVMINRCKLYIGKPYENDPYQGMIGFELFKKTLFVLDFENNVMWIKKAKGSRFEE